MPPGSHCRYLSSDYQQERCNGSGRAVRRLLVQRAGWGISPRCALSHWRCASACLRAISRKCYRSYPSWRTCLPKLSPQARRRRNNLKRPQRPLRMNKFYYFPLLNLYFLLQSYKLFLILSNAVTPNFQNCTRTILKHSLFVDITNYNHSPHKQRLTFVQTYSHLNVKRIIPNEK